MSDHDEPHHFLHPPPMRHRPTTSDTCGEIVEVEGGHIIRSTGTKDRHSRVCTAKGPRDRRVRLSAHTAIQFYDVQDRLGFDRPSKAVDWLIKKAQTSIDELAQLPPWNPADAIRNAAVKVKTRRTAAKTKISPSPPPPQRLQQQHVSASEPVLFYGQSSPFGYDGTWTGGWEQQSVQRLVAWNSGGATDAGNGGGGGYLAPTSYQSLLGQSQLLYSQRGPLQSSYTPMIRAWFDYPPVHQYEFSSGFGVPARFQGQEEEQHDGFTNKPSPASSISRR
ncbi:unnamed protein product [Eruca vesicaria subsp. sativa]|uniref:TCP domain-containing protein n=1 Tax=Eruca vesicaria subsp. sativa TaxID=29727 RepID=A0ABC8M6Y6_ERUVS|nr:unnamed protein product [Eruca vesicaria subsp. sativa]